MWSFSGSILIARERNITQHTASSVLQMVNSRHRESDIEFQLFVVVFFCFNFVHWRKKIMKLDAEGVGVLHVTCSTLPFPAILNWQTKIIFTCVDTQNLQHNVKSFVCCLIGSYGNMQSNNEIAPTKTSSGSCLQGIYTLAKEVDSKSFSCIFVLFQRSRVQC